MNLRVAEIDFDGAAQPADVHVQGARIFGVGRVPGLAEERLALHHLAGMLHEDAQERHQARGQAGLAAADAHPALDRVQLDRAGLDQILAFGGQQRADAVDQFLQGEGQGEDDIGQVFFFERSRPGAGDRISTRGVLWACARSDWQMRFPLVRMEAASTMIRCGVKGSRRAKSQRCRLARFRPDILCASNRRQKMAGLLACLQ